MNAAKILNKRIGILISILLVTFIMFCFGIHVHLVKSANKSQNTDLAEIIDYMCDTNPVYYDSDIVDKWETHEKKQLLSSEETTYPAEVNFIKGNLAMYHDNLKGAITYYNTAINAFDNNTSSHLKCRTYYELSLAYIQEGDFEASDKAADMMPNTFKNETNKDFLFDLNMTRSFDVLDMPDGPDKAVQLMEKTYKMATQYGTSEMDTILYVLSSAYDSQGNTVKAMDYRIKALEEAEKSKNISSIITISADIGIAYVTADNYSKAIEYLKKAYSYNLPDKEEDLKNKAYILNYIGIAYMYDGDYKNAELYFDKNKQAIDEMKNSKLKNDTAIMLLLSRADLKIRSGNLNGVFIMLDEANDYITSCNDFFYTNPDLYLYTLYGKAYYTTGNYAKSLDYLKLAEKRTLNTGQQPDEELLTSFYQTYKAMGNHEAAYKYIEKVLDQKNEAYKKQESMEADFIVEKFDTARKEKQISTLEFKNAMLKIIFIALSIILVFLLAASYFIVKQNREIKRLNALFKTLSEVDSLTQIANRRALTEFLEDNWNSMMAFHENISIAMMDVDFFKNYNDNYGHPAGDKVLQSVSKVLHDNCRETDFVARYGGEEFILIMPNTTAESSMVVLKRIQNALNDLNIKHEYSNVSDHLTISIGITTLNSSSNLGYVQAIKDADTALYKAKQIRNTIVHL